MANIFGNKKVTIADKINTAVRKKNLAIHVFTTALAQLKESNAGLAEAKADVADKMNALRFMDEEIDQTMGVNDALIENIGNILK